ncbi:MAG: Uncharacterized protein G01um10147_342 [Microgenomates group bacterium Gr01-1014_7]|nr:MAG: Uncharacterized protein G01um10147_342 [Microgenomates group bacterium Gr01-1014_7]
MTIQEIQDLKTFFSAIKVSGQRLEQIQGLTPERKTHCLQLLRELPQFQGDKFKDDNVFFNYLREYLRNEGNRKFLSGEFKEGRVELTEALEEKPVAVGTVSEQPGGQEGGTTEQVPVGEPASSMAGGMPFPGMAGGAAATPRRIIRNVPRAPEPTPGQTTSSGAAAKVTMTNPAVSSTTGSSSGLSGNLTYNLNPKAAEEPSAAKTAGRRFQAPKIPMGIRSLGSSIASKAGIFLKTNVLPITRTALGGFAGGVLTGSPLGALFGGVGGATWNSWGMKALNGTINAGARLSNIVGRGGLKLPGGNKKVLFLFLGAFGLIFLTGFIGGLSPGGGGAAGTLDYTIPFRDPSVTVSSSLTAIVSIASQITPLLYPLNPNSPSLEDRLYHNKRDEPGVYYWCTFLIVDAYNRAGYFGLSRGSHAAVLTMKSFFANTAGYQLLQASSAVEQLRPGDVIFFEGIGNQHASLIRSVEVSQEGNGVIRTYDANNVVTEDVVSVQNHRAINAQTTARRYNITGFGQATR